MFFKKDKQRQKEHVVPMLAHLDNPTEYPSATLFQVSGWAVCESPIESIKVGNETMQLSQRVDVLEAHPNYAFAVGFSGLARESDIVDQLLEISALTHNGEYTASSKLGVTRSGSRKRRHNEIRTSSQYP